MGEPSLKAMNKITLDSDWCFEDTNTECFEALCVGATLTSTIKEVLSEEVTF